MTDFSEIAKLVAGAITPGPWAAKKAFYPVDQEFDTVLVDSDNKVIAECFGRVAEGDQGLRPSAANAAFIAAAREAVPALLKALAEEEEDSANLAAEITANQRELASLRAEVANLKQAISGVIVCYHAGLFKGHEDEPWIKRVLATSDLQNEPARAALSQRQPIATPPEVE